MRIGLGTVAAHCCGILALLTVSTHGYIPAQATNNTELVNATDSQISLSWSDGTYSVPVSFQLMGSGSEGQSKGAIVHYSENNASAPPSVSPFIALISCDRNITNTTIENDIFTMANSSGAIAALLYTTTSQACLINPDYANPDNFDRVLDIYTTVRMSSAKLIESQWGEVNRSYYWYDSALLNDSYDKIEPYHTGQVEKALPGFLMATLIANLSAPINSTSSSGGGGGGNGGGDGGDDNSPNTSTAMIILYAITGCVSALFCVVILLGAIKAFRHPERYGPRPGLARFDGEYGLGMNGAGMPQSRAVGLGRAVLDSFPLIKFGAATNTGTTRRAPYPTYEDPENSPKALDAEEDVEPGMRRSESKKVESRAKDGDQNFEMTAGPSGARSGHNRSESRASSLSYNPGKEHLAKDPEHHRHPSDQIRSLANSGVEVSENDASGADLLNQSAIGRETCPICIVDFENGDDIRVLPCEGRHQFHQACVDPWLLELSSSCPICRADFAALETMAAGLDPGYHVDGNHSIAARSSISLASSAGGPASRASLRSSPPPVSSTIPSELPTATGEGQPSSSTGRFARYVRFAQNRRRRNEQQANITTTS